MVWIKVLMMVSLVLSGFWYVNLSPLEKSDVNSKVSDFFKKDDTINQTINNINNTNVDFTIIGQLKNYGRPSTTTEVQVEIPCKTNEICAENFGEGVLCNINTGECYVTI